MARKFFYVCAGLLLLALSFQLGARTATAQVGATIVGTSWSPGDGYMTVLTSSGDIYMRRISNTTMYPELTLVGNFWSGGPTAAAQRSWGAVKVQGR